MKVVIQRVKSASVTINDKLINKIDEGLLLLVGFTPGDNKEDIAYAIHKIVNLRIFADKDGLMNKNILDVNGQILSISQFTLYANLKKGNRPSFQDAMDAQEANKLYELFNLELNKLIPTFQGVFGADMQISLINDGPVTIILDTNK